MTTIIRLAIPGLIFLSLVSCQPQPETTDPVPNPDINAIMDAHAEELMAIDGVTGVAVGALDDGRPCILILIYEESDSLLARLPGEIQGHPVQTMVTGEIRPMNDTQDS